MGLQGRVELAVADARGQRPQPAEQRGQQGRDGNADLESPDIFDAIQLPARGRSDLPEPVVPHLLHRHDPGLADGVADDIADSAIHCGPDLIIGPEGEADARQARERHQRRQGHAGRRQQFDTSGAKLRQHLGIAAELAVGEDRHVQPTRRLAADRARGFRQPDREGVVIRCVDAELELELGRSAGGFGQDGGCPGSRRGAKQTSAGYCPPERIIAPGTSFLRTAGLRKMPGAAARATGSLSRRRNHFGESMKPP